TVRKEAEAALHASEQRFRTAVGIVSSLIWTNTAEGRMEGEQPGWSHFTGQSPAEYEGYGWAAAVHPDDAQPSLEAWQKAVAEKRVFEFEHRVRRHDGVWRLCAIRAIPLFNDDGSIREWLGVHTDITERRRTEKNATFLAEVSQDLASITGLDHLMETVGAKISAHFGLSLCTFVEVNDAAGEVRVTHDWHREDVPSVVGFYSLRDYLTEDFQLQGRAGKPFVVNDVATDPRTSSSAYAAMKIHSFVCVPLVQDGEWRFELCIYHSEPHEWLDEEITLASELTARVWARLERLRIEAALADRVAELAQADQNKDEFLAMLAHELRNPIASISNAVSLLKSSSDSESRDWGLRVMERQTHQLATLVDDLLDVSRITTGKIRLRREIIDLATILDRACETVGAQVKARHHEMISDYSRGTLWVDADPTRLEQVVLNLLSNAVKYTPNEGTIRLSSARQSDKITVTIEDNGIGIGAEKLPEIFELFSQGERAIDRSEGGLGIGLTIVQKLVDMHGGTVEAHSEGLGLGSRFTVTLHAVDAPENISVETGLPVDLTAPRGLRVLVVDDNIDSAHGLQRLLARSGHRVTLAFDGIQALNQAKETSPEAVILDIGLPGMDGFEVVKQLRNEVCCSASLIIALTGYGQEEDRQRAFNAGFDHHLVKPVDMKVLKRLLCDVVENS
ncbi:MAG: putative histidine kinase, hybrid, partial [Verrucomicrobiaceae bacterium]|nr:putative histidine kinase, hybrid [Verrucomicrobiaceae bacterium]